MAVGKYGPADSLVFYPFKDEETGLYGIKYQDQVVMLPYFEDLKGENRSGIFIYTDGDKSGLFSINGFVTPPVFDKIKQGVDLFISTWFGTIGDKWYLIKKDGLIEMPFECEDVFNIQYLGDKGKQKRISYILKPKGGKWSIFSIGGLDLLPENGLSEDFLEHYLHELNYEKKIDKARNQFDKYYKEAKKDGSIKDKLFFNEEIQAIYDRHMGNSSYPDPSIPNIPIEIGRFEGFVNELGIISIPIIYDRPQQVLERDPQNIYALEAVWEKDIPGYETLSIFADLKEYEEKRQLNAERNYNSALLYAKLAELALEQGFDPDCPLVLKYLSKSNVEGAKRKLDNIVAENQRNQQRRATIDAVGNSLMNIINSSAEAYATTQGNNFSDFDPTDMKVSNFSNSSLKQSSKNNQNVSEQMRCNADKRVYERYESMLSKAKASGNASVSEMDEWKSKMSALRLKWEKKGYSFPHSPLE